MIYFDVKDPIYDQMVMYASIRRSKGVSPFSLKKYMEKMTPIDVKSTEIITDQSRLIGGKENG